MSASYLGGTLDRTLIYNLANVAPKIKTRNNNKRKLANTNWGSDPNTLRISALALILTLQLLNTVPQSEN